VGHRIVSVSQLDLAADAFVALCTSAIALSLDTTGLAPDLPVTTVPLDELRRLLLAGASQGARDAVWAEVIRRARRDESWLLAAVGMRPSELSRMVLSEAGGVWAGGALVGAAASILMLSALFSLVPVLIGYRDPFRMDGMALVVYGVVALVVVLAAAAWPAWRTARVEVLEALQYE